eukprot:SM000039S14461  [mRNA]  locus=s39:350462:351192:+ [translate_table: standard]
MMAESRSGSRGREQAGGPEPAAAAGAEEAAPQPLRRSVSCVPAFDALWFCYCKHRLPTSTCSSPICLSALRSQGRTDGCQEGAALTFTRLRAVGGAAQRSAGAPDDAVLPGRRVRRVHRPVVRPLALHGQPGSRRRQQRGPDLCRPSYPFVIRHQLREEPAASHAERMWELRTPEAAAEFWRQQYGTSAEQPRVER